MNNKNNDNEIKVDEKVENSNDLNLSFKNRVINKFKDNEFQKNLACFGISVAILMFLTGFVIPLSIQSYMDKYMEENFYSYQTEMAESIKIDKEVKEFDEENVLIVTTMTNVSDSDIWIKDNCLNIQKIICEEAQCKHEEKWACCDSYIKLYSFDDLHGDVMVLKSKESKIIEFKVPKKFQSSNEYIITNDIETENVYIEVTEGGIEITGVDSVVE